MSADLGWRDDLVPPRSDFCGMRVVGSSDAAAAVVYLDAQIARYPRVMASGRNSARTPFTGRSRRLCWPLILLCRPAERSSGGSDALERQARVRNAPIIHGSCSCATCPGCRSNWTSLS